MAVADIPILCMLLTAVGSRMMNGATVQNYFVPMAGGLQAVYGPGSGNLLYYRHADWLGSSRFAATSTGSMFYDRRTLLLARATRRRAPTAARLPGRRRTR